MSPAAYAPCQVTTKPFSPTPRPSPKTTFPSSTKTSDAHPTVWKSPKNTHSSRTSSGHLLKETQKSATYKGLISWSNSSGKKASTKNPRSGYFAIWQRILSSVVSFKIWLRFLQMLKSSSFCCSLKAGNCSNRSWKRKLISFLSFISGFWFIFSMSTILRFASYLNQFYVLLPEFTNK